MTPQDWKRIQKGIFAGESGGDYNALFNYQNRPDGRFADIDLQNMTIDQALDFAKPSGKYGQYVKSQVGHVATPMGAYQIVGSTLRDAKRGLGLRGDELMTPEMQDRLGQWIYQKQGTGAWAGYKPQPSSQDIADQTMTALGRGPRGILAPTEPEAQPMIAEQQPKGLLASLGIQKMQPGAEGETGQRFYERDTFKDTAARMAQGFAALGGNPAVQKFAADVAAQRTEGKARNKTAEYLRRSGRADLAGMVEQGLISGRDAAGAIMQQPKDERTSLMKNYEFYIGKGMSPEEAMQAVKSGTSVTIGQKGADQFDKLDSTALSEVSQAGMTAARSLTQIDRLEELLSNVDTGVAASVKDLAGNFGINTEGLDDIQAAKALINNLVPQQRAPGSGPMSDKDLEIFKQSLPRLINQPGGNEIILQTMRGIAQYDAAGFDIVQKYRSGEIDKQQAFAQLRNRPDPFAGIRLGSVDRVEMDRGRALELLTGESN